jgi:hypothetical protein
MAKKKLYGKTRTIPTLKSKLDVLSWVEKGKTRKLVFLSVGKRTTPSSIVEKISKDARKSASHYSQVSRALSELERMKLVKCLNPKEKTGRFYALTGKGEAIKKEF